MSTASSAGEPNTPGEALAPQSAAEAASPTPEAPASGASIQGENAGSPPADGADKAGSPPAEGKDEQPKSYLDAVDAALKKPEAEQSSGSEGGEPAKADEASATDAGKDGAVKADEKADEADAEDKDPPPFHKHPRWQKMLKQRNDARAEAETLKGQVTEYEASHRTVEGLREYMTQANLDLDEVNTGLDIMRLMKAATTPEGAKAALKALTPYFQGLQIVAGDALPEDLQERVGTGALDEDSARELAQSRTREAAQAAEAKRAKDMAEARTRTEAATVQETASTAANAWADNWAKTDPDYDKKRSRVMEKLELRLLRAEAAGTLPKTAAEVTAMCDVAKAEVEAEIKAMLPKPRKIDTTAAGGSSQVGAIPEPKTYQEALEAGLRMSGKG